MTHTQAKEALRDEWLAQQRSFPQWSTDKMATLMIQRNELLEALKAIANHLDADNEDSYRADDPERAMDTAFALAKTAIAKAEAQ